MAHAAGMPLSECRELALALTDERHVRSSDLERRALHWARGITELPKRCSTLVILRPVGRIAGEAWLRHKS